MIVSSSSSSPKPKGEGDCGDCVRSGGEDGGELPDLDQKPATFLVSLASGLDGRDESWSVSELGGDGGALRGRPRPLLATDSAGCAV